MPSPAEWFLQLSGVLENCENWYSIGNLMLSLDSQEFSDIARTIQQLRRLESVLG